MNFWIQAGAPAHTAGADADDESLGDAIETVFPLQTEAAFLVWGHVCLPLSYKYDFGTIIDDLLYMLESVLDAPDGQTSVHWPSNTFNAEWMLKWSRGTMNVEANWHSVVGGTEAKLNSVGGLSLPTRQFVAEWKRPLQIIASGLEKAGYAPASLRGLHRLLDVVSRMPDSGVLYTGHMANFDE